MESARPFGGFYLGQSSRTASSLTGATRLLGVSLLLTVMAATAAAQPVVGGIANAAPHSVPTGNVARGELISIYGTGLASGSASAFGSPTTSLAGASVSFSTG